MARVRGTVLAGGDERGKLFLLFASEDRGGFVSARGRRVGR